MARPLGTGGLQPAPAPCPGGCPSPHWVGPPAAAPRVRRDVRVEVNDLEGAIARALHEADAPPDGRGPRGSRRRCLGSARRSRLPPRPPPALEAVAVGAIAGEHGGAVHRTPIFGLSDSAAVAAAFAARLGCISTVSTRGARVGGQVVQRRQLQSDSDVPRGAARFDKRQPVLARRFNPALAPGQVRQDLPASPDGGQIPHHCRDACRQHFHTR